jgi:hypothetical protein
MSATKPKCTQEQVNACVEMLLKRKTHNYGYDPKDYGRIKRQRLSARNAVRYIHMSGVSAERLEQAGGVRLDIANCTYTVGQSENEEITNLLRRIVDPEAKWLS